MYMDKESEMDNKNECGLKSGSWEGLLSSENQRLREESSLACSLFHPIVNHADSSYC